MKPRSPRFPFIPLEEAVELLRKLDAFQADSTRPLTRPEMLKSLDYGSFHGAAIKTIGALRAYDLLIPEGDGVVISPVGRQLLSQESEEVRVDYLRRAALSPLAFRMIWRRARHHTRDELTELLLERGFTEPGAKRAAKVYRKNSKLARLEELELEPALPERGPEGNPLKGDRPDPGRRLSGKGPRINPDSLTLPFSTGHAIIPKGITEAEFNSLMQTLRTWRDQLIAAG